MLEITIDNCHKCDLRPTETKILGWNVIFGILHFNLIKYLQEIFFLKID